MVDASGIPLAVSLTGGNRNEVTQLVPLLDDLAARPVPLRLTKTSPEANRTGVIPLLG